MPQVTIKGYLPNGLAVEVSENAMSFEHAIELSNNLIAAGMLTAPPVNEGLERELIITVMRREKSDGTPIIDFYPEWGAASVDTPYGTYKFVHKYLNNNGDVDQFLNASGFNSLQDIPLYDGQAPLKRSIGKPHAKETRVPTPFIVLRKEGKEKLDSEGKPYKPWELAGYEVASQQPSQNAPESHQNGANSNATGQSAQNAPDTLYGANAERVGKFLFWAQNKLQISHGQTLEALQYFSFNKLANVDDYEGTTHQAMAACVAYVCKYDIANIGTAQFADGSEVAPGVKQLAIEMIELNNVPF